MTKRTFAGFDVVVENPAGSTRQWYDRAAGTSGETVMRNDYGFLEGHVGTDGDEVDVYLGPDEGANFAYVVHQNAAPDYDKHDEDKVMLGFRSTADALAAFLVHRSDGDRAYGGMTAIPIERFRDKLERRTGTGKIRHESKIDRALAPLAALMRAAIMRIEQRGSKWVVLPESGDKVLGTHDTKEGAEAQLRAIEASKAAQHQTNPSTRARSSDYTAAQMASTDRQNVRRLDMCGRVSFDVDSGGKVRVGVWDRICVPGRNVKDDEETIFDARTCGEMVANFARRGDPIMIDWNHQSSFAHENGQPAPALGFYGALASVFGGKVVACEYARGIDQTQPPANLEDGLWGLRTAVTPQGHELLPGFRMLSPTFTPEGVDQQGRSVGYSLLAVAATNTPWQAGTQITFGREPVNGNRGVVPMNPKMLALAALIGLKNPESPKAIRAAVVQKFEDEAAKMSMEEKYNYGEAAAHLEDMAKKYEEAHFEEEDGDEPPHTIMRKMAAKMARLAKLDDGDGDEDDKKPADKKLEKPEPPVEHEGDDATAMQTMAASLGLPKGAKPRQIATAMEAKTVGLDKLGEVQQQLVNMQKERAEEKRVERQKSGALAFEQACHLGRTKEEKRTAFLTAFERSDKEAEELLFAEGTFPATGQLFSRMTLGGDPAPIAGHGRGGAIGSGPDARVVTMSALGSSQKAVVTGERLSAAVTAMADSVEPAVKARVEKEMEPGTLGTKYEAYGRYMASERLLKKERPELFAAAKAAEDQI